MSEIAFIVAAVLVGVIATTLMLMGDDLGRRSGARPKGEEPK